MSNRAASEGLEAERSEHRRLDHHVALAPDRLLLRKRSLETSPLELRQALGYVHRLRACWEPEEHAMLVVPASWTAFLPCGDGKCGHVRFKTRVVAPAEDVPRDVVSQVLTNVEVEGSLATLVSRAFESAPRTRIESDVRVKFSQSTRQIDFALNPKHARRDTSVERGALLLGVGQPHAAPDFGPLPEELVEYGRSHLTFLAQRANRTFSGSFPEWLVLFVLVYDAFRLRIVACMPRRRESDEIDCAPYVVDELAFRSSFADGCEQVLERVRFLLALRTLRRHVDHLAKSLFTPREGIRHISGHSSLRCSVCDRDDCLGSSHHCSSEYSTCPSSVHTYKRWLFSSSGSFSSSCCSTCPSVLESVSSSDSVYSQESQYMEPSTLSLYQGKGGSNHYPGALTETRRREIIAWTQQVIPTEHPIKDNYRMVISRG